VSGSAGPPGGRTRCPGRWAHRPERPCCPFPMSPLYAALGKGWCCFTEHGDVPVLREADHLMSVQGQRRPLCAAPPAASPHLQQGRGPQRAVTTRGLTLILNAARRCSAASTRGCPTSTGRPTTSRSWRSLCTARPPRRRRERARGGVVRGCRPPARERVGALPRHASRAQGPAGGRRTRRAPLSCPPAWRRAAAGRRGQLRPASMHLRAPRGAVHARAVAPRVHAADCAPR